MSDTNFSHLNAEGERCILSPGMKTHLVVATQRIHLSDVPLTPTPQMFPANRCLV